MLKIMKKMTFVACTAMLASAVAFTGCNSDKNEPGQPKVVESVTTDLNISLPANATGGVHRMPGEAVQTNNGTDDFQGMGNICLIPFGLAKGDTVTASDTKIGAKLADITDIVATSELKAVSKAKKYPNVQIPVGTSAFLFYAESKYSDASLFNKGKLTYVEATTNAGSTKFELQPIVLDPATITGSTTYTKLLAYVQGVADAVDGDPLDPGTKAWKEYTNDINEGMTNLFNEYKATKNLNSFNIERMMNDLLATISLTNTTLTDNMRAAIKDEAYVTYNEGTKKVALKSDDNLNNFPACFNIPDGSVTIGYAEGTFSSSLDKTFLNKTGDAGMNVAPLDQYVYPSSLWYYANTTIKTSNESEATALDDATHDWDWVLGEYPNLNSAVDSKTRSVALIRVINYAVGRLDVKVKLASANLQDNATPNKATIDCDSKLALSAVLIGGQKNVGFDFNSTSYVGENSGHTIYDKNLTSAINATTTFGNANSTLVLETADNTDVMIAIEMINNTGSDFVGADGVVPNGGKFYLVGKLIAENATTPKKRVFMKDYTTTAQLNITNLEKAYNTIPDLRTPTLEIGLSVDLSWVPGTLYNIDL